MKVALSSVKPSVRTGFVVMAVLIIVFLDIWALVGIFNDRVTVFRYMNYFGYYVPLLALATLVVAIAATRTNLLRLVITVAALPVFILPYLLASFPFSGAKWELGHQSEGTDISLVSYSKMSRNADYKRVAQLLDCSKTDLFLIQEAADFSALLDAAPEVLESCYYSFEGGDYKSLVLLSRFPIMSTSTYRYHNSFDISVGGTPITLMTARIDKSLGTAGRAIQSQQITDITAELPEAGPVIFAGDFNATPHNNTIFRMKESMAYAEPDGVMFSTFTFPAEGRWYARFGALIRIDHIFYRGLSLHSSRVLDDSYGSDHYPVRAVFTVPDTLEGSDE